MNLMAWPKLQRAIRYPLYVIRYPLPATYLPARYPPEITRVPRCSSMLEGRLYRDAAVKITLHFHLHFLGAARVGWVEFIAYAHNDIDNQQWPTRKGLARTVTSALARWTATEAVICYTTFV